MDEKLNYEKFKEYIKNNILNSLPEEYQDADIEIREILKNNVKTESLVVVKNEPGALCPSIRLDKLYDDYINSDLSVEDMIESLKKTIIYADTQKDSFVADNVIDLVSDKNFVLNNIRTLLLSEEKNMEALKSFPNRKFDDLALIYKVVLDKNGENESSIKITNELADSLGLTENDLYKAATKDMLSNIKMIDLQDMVMSLMSGVKPKKIDLDNDINDEMGVYVLTSDSLIDGASVIASEDVRKKVGDFMGGDYIIIPSSVHEVLIYPMKEDMDIKDLEQLTDMVHHVNASNVDIEDQLSDYAYVYDYDTDVICRADRYDREYIQELKNEKENQIDNVVNNEIDFSVMHVAVQSTEDYQDIFFNPDIFNKNNPYPEQEYFRVVSINNRGGIEGITPAFATKEAVDGWFERVDGKFEKNGKDFEIHSFEELTKMAEQVRNYPAVIDAEKQYQEELKLIKEKMKEKGFELVEIINEASIWTSDNDTIAMSSFEEIRNFAGINAREYDNIVEENNIEEKVDDMSMNTNIENNNENIKTPHGEDFLKEQSLSDVPVEERKEAIAKMMEDGIRGVLDSESFANWCKSQGRLYANHYSFQNAMLTVCQKPDASYVCGYEKWKEYGRQVKQGAKAIYIYAPAKITKGTYGNLFSKISKSCYAQFKSNPDLEFASFKINGANVEFKQYKNGLYDVEIAGKVIMAHAEKEKVKKFVDTQINDKMATGFTVKAVYDIQDTITPEHLWMRTGFTQSEMVKDDHGLPIKNRKGEFKIVNTPERINKLDLSGVQRVTELDNAKMDVLYSVLKKVSENNRVPFLEASTKEDKELADGSLGYFSFPRDHSSRGKIVISSELDLTNKVSVAFHEITHSRLHFDYDALRDEMDLDAGEKITASLKETQAEAVAYMTASNFGIETEHKSFNYIAAWSNGRDLKELKESMNLIYKESEALMKDIEKELKGMGYDLSLEKIEFVIDEEKSYEFIKENKDFTMNLYNATNSKLTDALDELKDNDHPEEAKSLLSDIVTVFEKIKEEIGNVDLQLNNYEEMIAAKEMTAEIQQDTFERVAAAKNRIADLQKRADDLRYQYIEAVIEGAKNRTDKEKAIKETLLSMYKKKPFDAIKSIQGDYDKLKSLSDSDISYIAANEWIGKTYQSELNKNTDVFVEGAVKHLEELKSVMSKNGVAVEIVSCENWGEELFTPGDVMNAKTANELFEKYENRVRDLKEKANEADDYYPYVKCRFTIWYENEGNLMALHDRYDIGDGYSNDLKDFLDKGEKDIITTAFDKSLKLDKENKYVKATSIKESTKGKSRKLSSKEWNEKVSKTTTGKTKSKEQSRESVKE